VVTPTPDPPDTRPDGDAAPPDGDGAPPEGDGDRALAGETVGICCSGGGLRSAAFNLGALQALDAAGVLRRADYLSAVSGGSYIASAYAVASRHSDPDLLARQPAYAPGSPEERWLRNHCSYLTDGVADTLRVVATAVVGLIANLVFFTTLLWTLARPLGWAYAAWQPALRVPEACTPGQSAEMATEAGCFDQVGLTGIGGWAVVAGVIAGLGLVLGLIVRMFQPAWPLRRSLRRVAAVLLVAGAAVGLVTVVLPELIVFTRNVLGGQPTTGPVGADTATASSSNKGAANLGLVATVGGALTAAALIVQVARPLRTLAATGVQTVQQATRWTARLSRGLRRVANLVLGSLIGPVVLAAVALLILNGGATAARPSTLEIVVWAVMAAATLVMLLFADVTSWSLHPFYKWRLARTFTAVRVPDGSPGGKATLLPYEMPLTLSEFAPDRYPGGRPGRPAFPELLVCAAVNVSDPGTTPPGRNGLSWVFSPSTIGYPEPVTVTGTESWWRRLLWPGQTDLETLSYGGLQIDTTEYEGRVGRRRTRDITLSAAVAISGAAVAPSMGKMTRAPLRFLLALTNVRLGVWLPNPANMPAGCSLERRRALPANPRQVRLLYEVSGRHRVRSKFLYVTDGGHVENLGLLELLRPGRECSTIVCLDAAGGSTTRFSTLGEAVSLAASTLNVAIDIDPTAMGRVEDRLNACDHVVGTIRYPSGATGRLIYGKALVTEAATWDVRAYAAKDSLFPVHPTTDQLLGGETFDAYQALGRCVGATCAAAALAPDAAGEGDGPAGAPSPGDAGGPSGPPSVATPRPTPVPAGAADVRVHDIAAATAELT
jgi:hypothetical protein